ncbi:MAG: ATP-binding cassette domain-containing protein [Bacteroidota bacterium]
MENLITINNLSKTHNFGKKNAKVVFKDIDLEIKSGSFVAIVGRNGSGKTTLLNIICGLEKFESGEIHFEIKNGKNSNRHSLKPDGQLGPILRKKIGIVSQRPSLWPHYNIFQNVVRPLIDCGYEDSIEEANKKALFYLNAIFELNEELSSMEFFKKYPDELSGGEYKRVALARIFATNPDILILDEFEANLDPWIVEDLLRYVEKNYLNVNGKSVLMVTHRTDLIIRLASDIVLVNDCSVKFFKSLNDIVKLTENELISWLDTKRDPNSVSDQTISFTKELIEKVHIKYNRTEKYKTGLHQLLVDTISGFISTIDRRYPHLILLTSKREVNHYIRGIRIWNSEDEKFALDGKNVDSIIRLVKKVEENKEDNYYKYELKNVHTVRKAIGLNGMQFNSGGSLISSMLNTTNVKQFKYNYHPFDPIPGVYGESTLHFSSKNKPYMEFSKQTKSVYLFPIKNQIGKVDAVISVDTYSKSKWLPFVVERLQMIVNVGSILINEK